MFVINFTLFTYVIWMFVINCTLFSYTVHFFTYVIWLFVTKRVLFYRYTFHADVNCVGGVNHMVAVPPKNIFIKTRDSTTTT